MQQKPQVHAGELPTELQTMQAEPATDPSPQASDTSTPAAHNYTQAPDAKPAASHAQAPAANTTGSNYCSNT